MTVRWDKALASGVALAPRGSPARGVASAPRVVGSGTGVHYTPLTASRASSAAGDLESLDAAAPKGGAVGQRYPDISTVNR